MTVAATEPSTEAMAVAGHAGTLSSRRNLVLLLSLVTMLTEVAFMAGWLPPIEIDAINLSMSLVPALVLGVACGSRLLGRSAIRRAAVWFWGAAGVLMAGLAVVYLRDGRIELYPALVLAALNEELVFRLAIPAVIAAALRVGNVRPNAARIAGLTMAGAWFVLLPGHVEQMTSPLGLLPYASFAALSALIVYRSGSILPLAIAHAISNLLTMAMWQDAVPADARSIGLACVLSLLVLAYGRSRRITVADDGGLVDTQTGLSVRSIDLRDGQPALVELADGRLLPVHAGMVRPPEVPMIDRPDASDPGDPDQTRAVPAATVGAGRVAPAHS